MKFSSLCGMFIFACGITSHAFACSPSHSATEFTYALDSVALDEKSRAQIASSIAQVTEPGASLEWVEVMVWRNTKPVNKASEKIEKEKMNARVKYLQELFVRLGSPLKVHGEVRQDSLHLTKRMTTLNNKERAEISIVHFKPCQCRINIPMPIPSECRRF